MTKVYIAVSTSSVGEGTVFQVAPDEVRIGEIHAGNVILVQRGDALQALWFPYSTTMDDKSAIIHEVAERFFAARADEVPGLVGVTRGEDGSIQEWGNP